MQSLHCSLLLAFLFITINTQLVVGVNTLENDTLSTVKKISNSTEPIHILALFSGTKNDLGIDHRIGRQVLKLALNQAKNSHPEVDIRLSIINDDTDCTSLNTIPNKVAEKFYNFHTNEFNENYCTQLDELDACFRQELDLKQLNEFLNINSKNKHFNNIKANETSHNTPPSSSITSGEKRIDAIIGPSCDYLVDLIARMASYWRTPMYSVTSIDASFSRKDIYTTLTRLSPSIDHLNMFLLKTLEQFKWKHLAIIIDSKQIENTLLLDNFERMRNKMKYLIPVESKVFTFSSFRNDRAHMNQERVGVSSTSEGATSDSSACTDEARNLLSDARRVARVFLLLLNNLQTVRRLLICAHEMHMNNGQFTFLSPDLGLKSSSIQVQTPTTVLSAALDNNDESVESLPSLEKNSNMSPTASHQRSTQNSNWFLAEDEANNAKAKEMFQSLMVFSVELPLGNTFNLFVEQTLDLVHQAYPMNRFERSSVNAVAVALHDSLLLAVEAHLKHRSKKNSRDTEIGSNSTNNLDTRYEEKDATLVEAPLMWNERFYGGLMSGMHINSNGDQELDYILSDMEPELAIMRPVASYSKETRELRFFADNEIYWPKRLNSLTREVLDNNEPPPDEPECGYNEDAEHCIDRQNLYAALTIVGILLILILASALASFRKYQNILYQMQLDDYWWKINWIDLKFIQTLDESLSNSAQRIARGIKLEAAANSVVSLDSDGMGSMVSGGIQSKSKITTTNPALEKSGFSVAQRKKRRAAVPTIITSDMSKQHNKSQAQFDLVSQCGQSSVGSKAASVIEGSCLIRSEYSSVVRASNLAFYKSNLVIVKQLNASNLDVSRELLVELKSMRMYIHDNLAKFIGLCVEPERLAIVYEYCSRGSLQDLLLNESVAMDLTLKYSIIGDIVNGLNFIHTTLLDYHGRLKSTNLVLDSRFTVKITDFGLQNLYSQIDAIENQDEDEDQEEEVSEEGTDDGLDEGDNKKSQMSKFRRTRRGKTQHDQLSLNVSQSAYNMESVSVRGGSSQHGDHYKSGGERRVFLKNRGASRFFWTAPEHLRDKNYHFAGSKRGDVYSLAIILFEILTRKEPYHYGTNAKPFWPSIRHDKKQHFLNHHQQNSTSPFGSFDRRISRIDYQQAGSQVSSFVNRQTKRAHNKLRRSGASVRPTDSNKPNPSSDAISIISGSAQSGSSHASGSEPVMSHTSTSHQSQTHKIPPILALGVGAIDEEQDFVSGAAGKGSGVNAQGIETKLDAEEILDQLRMGIEPEPVRPYLPNYVLQDINPKLLELIRGCWAESPALRPTLSQIRNLLRRITHGVASKNYLDNLLERLQNYAENLERIVDGKSSDILEEKMRTEELLYQLVPKFVADQLKRNEPIVPQVFDGVTIFFSDIVGFEKYSSVMSPVELVDLLNNIYSSFESIISSFDVTKIETIIDQFLVASGISLQNENKPSGRLAIDQQVDQQVGNQNNENEKSTEQILKNQDSLKQVGDNKIQSSKGRKRGLGILSSIRRSHADTPKKQNSLGSGSISTDVLKESDKTLDAPSIGIDENDSSSILGVSDLEHYKRTSAEQIARMALCIRDLVKSFHFRQNLSQTATAAQSKESAALKDASDGPQHSTCVSNIVAATFNIRIGMHSGKVCAGIVGVKRPKFCLIGDTVNVASRMHTNSKANRIQISQDTKRLLELVPGFNIEPRGKIEVKGKGMMETFWLESY